MPRSRPVDEIARLGDEIYERDVRRVVEDAHLGEYLALDVDTGSWSVAGSELAAARTLRARCPTAVDVWLLRIGYRATASIGGGALRRSR